MRVMRKMNQNAIDKFTLNFGVSSNSRYAPGYPWEERIIDIPLIAELPNISSMGVQYLDPEDCKHDSFNLRNYSDVREDKYTELPAVRFNKTEGDIYLVWIDQRKEWVAFRHLAWAESCNILGNIDEAEDGPYGLDSYCKDVLSKAFGGKKIEGDISRISPSELQRQAAQRE
jgi:hypothetical protein